MNKLNNTEKKSLIEKIQKGDSLPENFKEKLFPTIQKEYELIYAGKMRKEDVLADEDGVFAVPLQVQKKYNSKRENYETGWQNMVVFGDNLQFLKTIYQNKDSLIKDKIKGKIKLIYIDPPFGTKSDFEGNQGEKAYTDKIKDAEFIEFLRRRLIVSKEILADDGSIFIHLDQRKSHYIKAILDEVFGESNFRNEIVWKRFHGHNHKTKKLGINCDYIFFYTKTNNYTWNELYQPYDEKKLKKLQEDNDGKLWADGPLTGGYSSYRYEYKGIKKRNWTCPRTTMERLDKEDRLHFTSQGGIRVKKYLDESKGKQLQTLWDDISPINSRAYERVNYPTQKPEKLIQRIINLTTNKKDLVLDFFGGSGTVAAVSEKLNRKWITCDIGKFAFLTTQQRLLTIQNSESIDISNHPPPKNLGRNPHTLN